MTDMRLEKIYCKAKKTWYSKERREREREGGREMADKCISMHKKVHMSEAALMQTFFSFFLHLSKKAIVIFCCKIGYS